MQICERWMRAGVLSRDPLSWLSPPLDVPRMTGYTSPSGDGCTHAILQMMLQLADLLYSDV